MPVSEKRRVFLAVWPDPRALEALERAVSSAKKEADQDPALGGALRWLGSKTWHLTVAFIGHVDPAAVADLASSAREAALRQARFEITFGGAGAFPSLRRPRVLWVGIAEGKGEWQKFVEGVRHWVGRWLPQKREGEAIPHITVARMRKPADVGRIVEALATIDRVRTAVEKLCLVESKLAPSGASYVTLEEYPLLGS